jgi:hypothetical protein
VFSWIPCGHPPPLLVRGNKVIKELTRRPQLPLGLAELHIGTDRSMYGTLPRSDDGLPACTEQLRARAWQNGLFWVNDPDCLIVGPQVERREQWAAHIAGYGGLLCSSDRLGSLDAWGLEVTRRLLAGAARHPRQTAQPEGR